MEIKRLKNIRINSYNFNIIWDKTYNYGSFNYANIEIKIGTKSNSTDIIFEYLCHEIMEICAVEMNVRLSRPDCSSDFIFVYDHRQHDTMINMFASIISQFIK